ncbi:hypothetical protein BCR34DRAFT_494420 [Clohesyomyces aquaticus]|uniref:Apple domain-containing protein n=1 Tax=Clohesyomyces aquaticus TaxID=1231657 RepID=A0A1Y1YRJ4_9PLEO|nr:hypothetical protein BCR34DRAFT_494420 [Clohesyomyces aquaticus]
MIAATLLFTALASLSTALPTSSKLDARAGGPAIVPIPSSCAVTNPYPTASSSSQTYTPGPSADNARGYYAYYPAFSDIDSMQLQCLEQCYGYGNKGDCVSAFWAQNLPVPDGYYGSTGGPLMTGCLFFNRTLTPEDFVVAPEGQATTPYARNIQC